MQTLNRLVTRDRIVRVDRVFQRFDLSHRLEHGVLILAVALLLLTGLPQKYSDLPVSITWIGWLGGIETVRRIHRAAAILLALVACAHVLGTAYRFVVLRLPPHMLLLTSDMRDLMQGIRHRLGRAKEPPDMGRFTYAEKLLYWTVVWSVTVLMVTGLLMWNPIAATRFLTGQIIPAARQAHGSEALLLLMVGVGWHVWHVAVKQRNWSIFTGQMTEVEMIRRHPLEWDAIMDGRDRLPLDVAVTRHRRRRFLLIATPLTLAVIGCAVAFLGFQQTAIVTHPEREPVAVSVEEGSEIRQLAPPDSPGERPVPTWSGDIRPMLAGACSACHNQDDSLPLTDYDDLLAGAGEGQIVVPGQPGQSVLVTVQAGGGHPGQLTGDQLATVIVWIENGAPR